MRFYDRITARKPENIEKKKAYIIGGGIAGLAAATFLIKDAHMPAKNITVFEREPQFGGCMDAYGDAKNGYICRGVREPEGRFECLWYLCSLVPSLEEPGRTALDDIVEFNRKLPIYCHTRFLEKGGKKVESAEMKLEPEVGQRYLELLLTPDEELADKKVSDWFDDRFLESDVWEDFRTKLAFHPWSSLLEMKVYIIRFLHLGAKSQVHGGILQCKYNEYDSIVKPVEYWLRDQGVNLRTSSEVTDITIKNENGETVVNAIKVSENNNPVSIELTEDDYVFFTNGSLVANATYGTNTTVAKMNRDTKNKGVFTLWEKLAAQDPKFGHPEKFDDNIDNTHWISFFVTVHDYPQLIKHVEELTDDPAGTAGMMTFKDSAWSLSTFQHHAPFFPGQPENVQVFWNYGLHSVKVGDYVKKPMDECNGNEMLSEFLYHAGLKDKIDEILPHCKVSVCMMPYINSQFSPRNLSDRPKVIPEGCKNLAFMGQFVECGDAVFTVETSVRTAMEGVYGLLKLDKPVIPIAPTCYDIRVMADMVRAVSGEKIDIENLPAADPQMLIEMLEKIPSFPEV